MNGLRASNVIELRAEDVNEAEASNDYPGYFTFTNSRYKMEEKSSFFRKSYLTFEDLCEEITTYSKLVIQ